MHHMHHMHQTFLEIYQQIETKLQVQEAVPCFYWIVKDHSDQNNNMFTCSHICEMSGDLRNLNGLFGFF